MSSSSFPSAASGSESVLASGSASKTAQSELRSSLIKSHDDRPYLTQQTWDLAFCHEREDGVQQDLSPTHLATFRGLASVALTHFTDAATPASHEASHLLWQFTVRAQDIEDAFTEKFGCKPTPTTIQAEIARYLRNTPPKVIFAHLKGRNPNVIVWGRVIKGGDHDETNEMMLSTELMEAIVGTAPPELPQETRTMLSNFHRLAWLTAFLHELMHCLSRHLFRNLITPSISETVRDPKTGLKAGAMFEFVYFKFLLEMDIPFQRNIAGRRMWIAETQAIARLQNGHLYVLDSETIHRILDGFLKSRLWDLTVVLDLETYVSRGDHIRHRVGEADLGLEPGRGAGPLVGLGLQAYTGGEDRVLMQVGCGRSSPSNPAPTPAPEPLASPSATSSHPTPNPSSGLPLPTPP
ncbi:hypothetical protein C8R44DRAFT_751726 [Mycena epipterygia]|nr:hypothetical protein C8R44DRAFT_751726 [Mycena epipterygia]